MVHRQRQSLLNTTTALILITALLLLLQPTCALRGVVGRSSSSTSSNGKVGNDNDSGAPSSGTNGDNNDYEVITLSATLNHNNPQQQQTKNQNNRNRELSHDDHQACMEQASGISLGCTAQDIAFSRVRDFTILNNGPSLQPCNCTTTPSDSCNAGHDIPCGEYPLGTVFGACDNNNGATTSVTVQMNVDFLVKTKRYDIGMYIATNGGSALNGNQCEVSILQEGTYGDVIVWEVEGDTSSPNPAPDQCPDLGSSGIMDDYPFAPIELSCTDVNGDGLLDFDIGIVWSVKKGDYDCDANDLEKRPVASSRPKCWYDENFRATVPIYVPPKENTPEEDTLSPSASPTDDSLERESPPPPPTEECIDDFNVCYALDMSGSVCNRGANLNCGDCQPRNSCQDAGFTLNQCCANFEKVRNFAISMTSSLVDGYVNGDESAGENGMSVVEFATTASIVSGLSTDASETVAALEGMVYGGGWTHHAYAISACQQTLAAVAESGRRLDVGGQPKKNYIILVTDGIPTKPDGDSEYFAELAATEAKDDGTTILPVFISDQNEQAQLDYMKRLSNDGSVYNITAFDELEGLIGRLTSTVLCNGEGSLRARDDQENTPINTPVVIEVLDNDSGNGTLTVKGIIEEPERGTAELNEDGTVTYTPVTGFVGEDTFVYEMCDGTTGACDTALVTITIMTLPIAVDDSGTTEMNEAVFINVIPNDLEDGTANIISVGEPIQGTVWLPTDSNSIPEGQLLYIPPEGFTGTSTFTYTMCQESDDKCDDALVTVTVTPPLPEAVDDYETTSMNLPVEVAVIENDISTTPLSIGGITSQPTNGNVYYGGTVAEGSVMYYPKRGFEGTDTFRYYACDKWDQCDEALVTVVIGPPTIQALNDYAITNENQEVTVQVLNNDIGAEPFVVTEIPTSPTNGEATISPDGLTVVYVPNLGYVGLDSFTYTMCDESELCDTATVFIDVIMAVNDATSTSFQEPVDIEVLNNDIGESLIVTSIPTPPGNGVVTIEDDGVVTYTPNPTFVGVDNFVYEMCERDNLSVCDQATVTIDVILARDDYTHTPVGTPVTIDVFENDEGTNLETRSIISEPLHGSVEIQNSGQITYIPEDDFVGTELFQYQACTTTLEVNVCDTATVQVTIMDAIDDATSTKYNEPVTIEVLENDIGPNLVVTSIPSPPSNGGSVTIQDDGSVEYTPVTNFVGIDTFVYQACEEDTTNCDTATVTVHVLVAVDDIANTPYEEPTAISVLNNDNGGSECLKVEGITSVPSSGTATPQADGTILYDPNDNFAGIDTFDYKACLCDQSDVCSTATVVVDVILAVDDDATTPTGTPVYVPVLNNDRGDPLEVTTVTDPQNGNVYPQDDNTVLYIPNLNFQGTDTFTYTACVEGTDVCDVATVTVIVTPQEQNGPPEARSDVAQTTLNSEVEICVLENDNDPDDDPLTVTQITNGPQNGVVTVIEPTQLCVMYTPSIGFSGTNTFEYTTCDPYNQCDTAQVMVIVNPIANNDFVETRESETVITKVLENDLGSNLAVLYVQTGANGICTISSDGSSLVYTPMGGFIGRDQCSYTACTKNTPACATATLTVNIIAEPTLMPSAAPSEPPTEAWYYPDWINDEQVCKNDYLEPEYMLEVQRKNYLYRSKEECCGNHFWWRITQCMANEHPMYMSNGQICEQKTFLEYHESKFTPGDWDASDLYETLEECCVAKFSWDRHSCLAASPRELKYYFTMNVETLNEPEFCQDADIIANALVTALERGLDADMRADVTSIGCATISRNSDTGNPECGGCLGGSFLGDTLGKTVVEDAWGVVTPVTFEIRKKCYESKTDADIIMLTDYITKMLQGFINPGSLTAEIQSWSRERVPQVGQLFNSVAVPSSFVVTDIINPFAREDNKYYPDWVDKGGCINDGLEPEYQQDTPGEYLFDTAQACCDRWFGGSTECISRANNT